MNRPSDLPPQGSKDYKTHLHNAVVQIMDYLAEQDERMDEQDKVIEDLRTRVELMSTALSSTLTTKPEPEKIDKVQYRAQFADPPPPTSPRTWQPRGDGLAYWTDPKGFLKRRDEVPPHILDAFLQGTNVPEPEEEAEEPTQVTDE